DLVPARRTGMTTRILRADDVRQQRAGGAVAVAVHACREATQDVEHPLELALRVVKSPGAGPAVGTGVDGAVAMLADDASDLAGHQRGGTRPVDRHEGIGTAPGLAIAGQPAAANHRLIHAESQLKRMLNVLG